MNIKANLYSENCRLSLVESVYEQKWNLNHLVTRASQTLGPQLAVAYESHKKI